MAGDGKRRRARSGGTVAHSRRRRRTPTRSSSQCRGARRGRDACGADSSLQSEGRRVRKSRGVGTVADQGEQNARIRDTPSSASRIGDGEPESRRPQARNAGKRQKRTWHALEQADVKVHPAGARRGRVRGAARGGAARRLDGRRRRTHPTRRSENGEGRRSSMSCRGVRGRGGVCAARQRTTPSIFVNGRAAVVCQSDGERRIRLFSVSRMRLF